MVNLPIRPLLPVEKSQPALWETTAYQLQAAEPVGEFATGKQTPRSEQSLRAVQSERETCFGRRFSLRAAYQIRTAKRAAPTSQMRRRRDGPSGYCGAGLSTKFNGLRFAFRSKALTPARSSFCNAAHWASVSWAASSHRSLAIAASVPGPRSELSTTVRRPVSAATTLERGSRSLPGAASPNSPNPASLSVSVAASSFFSSPSHADRSSGLPVTSFLRALICFRRSPACCNATETSPNLAACFDARLNCRASASCGVLTRGSNLIVNGCVLLFPFAVSFTV